MKRIVFLITLSLFCFGQSFGQDKSSRADRATQKLDELVQLTPEQRTKVLSIQTEAATCMKNIQANSTLDENQKKEQLKTCRTKKRADLKSVLTPDQLAKLKEAAKERKKNKGQNGKKGNGNNRLKANEEGQELELLEEM